MEETFDQNIKSLSSHSLCKPLTNNEEDMTLLQGTLTNIISSAVQYGHENGFSIRTVCGIMNKQSESAVGYSLRLLHVTIKLFIEETYLKISSNLGIYTCLFYVIVLIIYLCTSFTSHVRWKVWLVSIVNIYI